MVVHISCNISLQSKKKPRLISVFSILPIQHCWVSLWVQLSYQKWKKWLRLSPYSSSVMNWIMANSVTLIDKLKFCFIWKYKKLYRILQVFEFLKVYIKENCSPEVKIVLRKRKKTKNHQNENHIFGTCAFYKRAQLDAARFRRLWWKTTRLSKHDWYRWLHIQWNMGIWYHQP